MFKVSNKLAQYTKSNSVLCKVLLRLNNFSSVPITAAAVRNIENDVTSHDTSKEPEKKKKSKLPPPKYYNPLVSAAFASLKNDIMTPYTDDKIIKAETVDELLSISEGTGVSRRHAFKVVTILAEWSNTGKVSLSEFETDSRFVRLCKILIKASSAKPKQFTSSDVKNEDLSTIVNIAADDEAAKLIASISPPQMVKVMSTLALKKRRSTPLLRSLAFNIARSKEKLDLKQCADILYSMAVLNFIDENLLQKACSDACTSSTEFLKTSAVIGSILISLGHLKYKDNDILDALSVWMLKHYNDCRPQDISAFMITIGILNYQPPNSDELYKVLIPKLNIEESNKPTTWLDIVWALVILNQTKPQHLSSVLNEKFISKIEGNSSKLKLLNVSSASELLVQNYDGPKLPADSSIRKHVASRSKSKEALVTSILDSLSNLVTPETHLKTNIDTSMGFYIDAEMIVDKKCHPLPLDKQNTSPDAIKIAVMAQDYGDICRGRHEPTGLTSLLMRLLEAQGYRILTVPYTEYNPKDKLANRVKYLEAKLRSLVH